MTLSPLINGAPDHELLRSPMSTRVGELAADSGLFLAHFEARTHLPWPEHWAPADRADLVGAPQWEGGALPEPKYMSFRHDQLVGSFHPGHRAKWSAHELCHGLVGFYWDPTATDLALALGARLAEALPGATPRTHRVPTATASVSLAGVWLWEIALVRSCK